MNHSKTKYMLQLKGIAKLNKYLDELQDVACEIRFNLDMKREWLASRSENWQFSEEGQDWENHLNEVEFLLDDIDRLKKIMNY